MKILTAVLAALILASSAFAVTPVIVQNAYTKTSGDYILAGGNTIPFTRGSVTFTLDDGIDSANTGWFQVAVSDSNTSSENYAPYLLGHDKMNLVLNLTTTGDSIGMSQIRVERGYDNLGYLPIRNADSTFILMNTGAYNSPIYAGAGGWLYETPFASAHGQATTATTYDSFRWSYKISIEGPGWYRITFLSADDIADNVTVTYTVEAMK